MDGYFTHTAYSSDPKNFNYAKGGPYTVTTNQLAIAVEFDTQKKENIGDTLKFLVTVKDDKLTLDIDQQQMVFEKIDKGEEHLAGL